MNSEIFATNPADIRHQTSSAALGTSIDVGTNCLDSIEGISIGHVAEGDTGTIVIAAPGDAIDAVDVRGGGPSTRETDLLTPEDTVERVCTVVLAGGSVYDLTAADGIICELRDCGIGFEVTPTYPDILVLIVSGAVILDLLLGESTLPTAELGREALSHTLDDIPEGTSSDTIDAGIGAMVGAIKGGFRQARVTSADDKYLVIATMMVNSFDTVIDPEGRLYEMPATTGVSKEALAQLNQVFVDRIKIPTDAVGDGESSTGTRNTTIGTVITDAPVTMAQLKWLAMYGHDGLARAIRPAHAPMDGDTLFTLSSAGAADGENVEPVSSDPVVLLAAMAVDAVQMAIVDTMMSATGRAEVAASSEMLDKQ